MRLATLRTALVRPAVHRSATLSLQLSLVAATFGLGISIGQRQQASAARSLPDARASKVDERQPVAGAVEAPTATPRTEALADESLSDDGLPDSALRSPKDPPKGAKKSRPPALPSWSSVAGRAQSWTAAIRADQNYGAGVVVDSRGLVLTNLHVIDATRSITVTPFGGEPALARVVDSDAVLDLALLALPGPTGLAATLGSAGSLGVGDEVLAVGSPRKMYFSVSRGMVSFPSRSLDNVDYIQTDLPINIGNSGGPLVDREGRVVGIVSFILKDSQGLSFALPIDRAVSRFAKYLGEAAQSSRAASL
jgi:S1-C subfamily serine protease